MVHYITVNSHAVVRTFITTLVTYFGGEPINSKAVCKGKFSAEAILGSAYDHMTVSVTYTLSTKRVQVVGPATIMDAAELTLKELDKAFSRHMKGYKDAFAGVPKSASLAVKILSAPNDYTYTKPETAAEAVESTTKKEKFETPTDVTFSSQEEYMLGEMLSHCRGLFVENPRLFNKLRTAVIKAFGPDIEEGFETGPMKEEGKGDGDGYQVDDGGGTWSNWSAVDNMAAEVPGNY